jgi:hypothetical protein
MKTINHTINGLASSLFLNVGLTRIAEKFDITVKNASKETIAVPGMTSSEDCTIPCNFTPESGQ